MTLIRRNAKLAGVFLTILTLYITAPFDSVLAAMIETEATLDLKRVHQARDEINELLLREDVQNALMAQGINPLEAKARIDSLSDAEVVRLADQIYKIPAGGNSIVVGLLIVLVCVLIVVAVDAFERKYIYK